MVKDEIKSVLKVETVLYKNLLKWEAIIENTEQLDYEYAFYLYKDDNRVRTLWYNSLNSGSLLLEEPGRYKVEAFARKKGDQNPCLIVKGSSLDFEKKIMLAVPLEDAEPMKLATGISKGMLTCWIQDRKPGISAMSFVLIKDGKEVVKKKFSVSGRVCFSIEDGTYYVRCFIRGLYRRYCLESEPVKVEKLPMGVINVERSVDKRSMKQAFNRLSTDFDEYQKISLEAPKFIMAQRPFVDFCMIFTEKKLQGQALLELKEQGFVVCRETMLGDKIATLLAPKDLVFTGDIMLSGFIYEREFVYGQEYIESLPIEFLEEKLFSEMTGTFTAVKYQLDNIILSTDLFGAGHLYCFEDKQYTIISNRLHLTLLGMRATGIRPKINQAYIAANLCYSERMISITNFTTDLIFEGLSFVPLNKYLRLSKKGTEYQTKTMIYEQIPYDEKEYCKLLDQAREDIVAKVNAIAKSGIFDRYIQEVTGGFDSRVSLAATLNSPEVVEKIRVLTRDVSTSKDLICSLMQTNYYHLPYYDRSEDPVKIVPVTLEKIDEENRSLAMGLYRSINVAPWPRYQIDEITGVYFGGYFGETMRSRYFGVTLSEMKESDSTNKVAQCFAQRVKDSLLLQDKGSLEYFVMMLQKQLDEIPGKNALEKFDNMYTFFHLRYHFGLGEYSKNVSNAIRISPFMSKYMLYASKMLTMDERFKNKIMFEMAHWLKPEIISFPYSSYGLEEQKIQLENHKNILTLCSPELLDVDIDTNDHNFYAVEERNKEFSKRCDKLLAQTPPGPETRNATRFVYLRLIKLLDVLEKENQLSFLPWSELREYTLNHQDENARLQPLYCKVMGVYDQLNIVLNLNP